MSVRFLDTPDTGRTPRQAAGAHAIIGDLGETSRLSDRAIQLGGQRIKGRDISECVRALILPTVRFLQFMAQHEDRQR